MLDDLEGHEGKHDLTDVWIETRPDQPPVTHRITFFDVKPCPSYPDNENTRHLFGGAETICGIVVIPADESWVGGHHIELLEEKPEIDCAPCMTIEGIGDPALATELKVPA